MPGIAQALRHGLVRVDVKKAVRGQRSAGTIAHRVTALDQGAPEGVQVGGAGITGR